MKNVFALMLLAGMICSSTIPDINPDGIMIELSEQNVTTVYEVLLEEEHGIKEDPVLPDQPLENIEEEVQYNVTAEERDMLATLVFLESSICSMDCQKAVASVIFNRLDSKKWTIDVNTDGKISLYDIIYYPNAFSPAHLITRTTPDEDSYAAVDYVIQNGPTVPTYVRYFRTKYDFKWDGYKGYCDIDNVYFGYMTDWQNGAW